MAAQDKLTTSKYLENLRRDFREFQAKEYLKHYQEPMKSELLKVASESPFDLLTVMNVQKQVKSIDKTIRVLDAAYKSAIDPETILNLLGII